MPDKKTYEIKERTYVIFFETKNRYIGKCKKGGCDGEVFADQVTKVLNVLKPYTGRFLEPTSQKRKDLKEMANEDLARLGVCSKCQGSYD